MWIVRFPIGEQLSFQVRVPRYLKTPRKGICKVKYISQGPQHHQSKESTLMFFVFALITLVRSFTRMSSFMNLKISRCCTFEITLIALEGFLTSMPSFMSFQITRIASCIIALVAFQYFSRFSISRFSGFYYFSLLF